MKMEVFIYPVIPAAKKRQNINLCILQHGERPIIAAWIVPDLKEQSGKKTETKQKMRDTGPVLSVGGANDRKDTNNTYYAFARF